MAPAGALIDPLPAARPGKPSPFGASGAGLARARHAPRRRPRVEVGAAVDDARAEAVIGRPVAGLAVAVERAGREPQRGRRLARAQEFAVCMVHRSISLVCPVARRGRPAGKKRRARDRRAHRRARRGAGLPRHPRPHPLDGAEPERGAPAQTVDEGGVARRELAEHVGLGAGGAQERLDLAPERGADGRMAHEGEEAVEGLQPQPAAPVERGHEARIAQRLDAEAPGAGAGPGEERAEKRAELVVEACHGRERKPNTRR